MNIANCRLMGLALGPQMPPQDVKSVSKYFILSIFNMTVFLHLERYIHSTDFVRLPLSDIAARLS